MYICTYTYINTYKGPIILIYLCYVRAITSPQLFSNTLTFDCNGKFVAMSRPATWKMQHVFSSVPTYRVWCNSKSTPRATGHRPQGLQRGLIYFFPVRSWILKIVCIMKIILNYLNCRGKQAYIYEYIHMYVWRCHCFFVFCLPRIL